MVMSSLGNISKNKLYLLRALGIGSVGAVGLIYLNYNKNVTQVSLRDQLLKENITKFPEKAPSWLQLDITKPSLTMDDRIGIVKKGFELSCGRTILAGLCSALVFPQFKTTLPKLPLFLLIYTGAEMLSGVFFGFGYHMPNKNHRRAFFGASAVTDAMATAFLLSMFQKKYAIAILTNFGLMTAGIAGYTHVTKANYDTKKGFYTGLIYGIMGNAILPLFFPIQFPQLLLCCFAGAMLYLAKVRNTQKALDADPEKIRNGGYDEAFEFFAG